MSSEMSWTQDQEFSDCYNASTVYQSRPINLRIDNDGEPFDVGIKMIKETLDRLDSLDEMAKQIISRDLRETYNENWREYDELMADGSYRTVTNPELSESKFKDEFALESIEVMGGSILTLWYSMRNDLFSGHGVFVQSFDGVDMDDAEAQMVG